MHFGLFQCFFTANFQTPWRPHSSSKLLGVVVVVVEVVVVVVVVGPEIQVPSQVLSSHEPVHIGLSGGQF